MEVANAMAMAAAYNKVDCTITNWDDFWVAWEKYVQLGSDDTAKLVFVNEEKSKVYSWLKNGAEEFKLQLASEDTRDSIIDHIVKFDNTLTIYKKFYSEYGSELFVPFFGLFDMDHSSWTADFSRTVLDHIDPAQFTDRTQLLNTAISKR